MMDKKFPTTAFARMARASGFSREEAEEKLRGKAPEAELDRALDKAFSEDPEVLSSLFTGGASAVEPDLSSGHGKDVDDRGRDAADRAALSVIGVMDREEPLG